MTDLSGRVDFTNALCARYGLAWVNEDLGIWSIGGRRLPYPLPPILTEAGLERAVRHVREVQAALEVPLVVEFPGFSSGTNVVLGALHAYDYFRRLAEACDVPVALDTGHLLSYQWWRGARGAALFDELERLPLSRCFEIHLSGCELLGDRFLDVHHGVLLPEQLELLERLLALCPRARCVAYEDPRVGPEGRLPRRAAPGFERLRALVAGRRPAEVPAAGPGEWGDEVDTLVTAAAPEPPWPRQAALLRGLLYDEALRRRVAGAADTGLPVGEARLVASVDACELDETAAAIAREVRRRRQRGSDTLERLFAQSLAGAGLGPDEPGCAALFARFTVSAEYRAVRETPDGADGDPVELAFARFLAREGVGDLTSRRRELIWALLRALAVTPTPAFEVPAPLRRCPGGWFALERRGDGPPILMAAVRGRLLRGAVTERVAALIAAPAPRPLRADPAVGRLVRLGLLG